MRKETDNQEKLKEIEASSDEEAPELPAQSDQLLSVKVFRKNYKIKHTVDFYCTAWNKITIPTIKHAWAPLLPHLNIKEDSRQTTENIMHETVEAVRAVPGMSSVTETDIRELIGTQDQDRNIDEMLEDEDEEDREEPVIEAEPSTKQLSDILASLANLQEQIETVNFDTRQEALTHIEKLNRLIDEKYNAKIQASQQSLITRYLRRENEERAAVR